MKTKYDSYCLNGIAEGCKYCVRGEKLVLFVTGICKRGCWYCSLSNKRKNKDVVYANERKCKSIKDIVKEVQESKATSAGITGGDPLIYFNRTIKLASQLKKKFGKKFHIHIYLPTKFVSEEKLRKLSKYIDEVRFHPNFLIDNKTIEEDINKIRLAELFWNKPNLGIELPMIPDKKREILNFILKIKDYVGFVNLNEFELSETNFNIVTKKYKLREGGYVVKDSLETGKWILNELNKKKIKLNVHLCTAQLKNNWQFANRLKRHESLPYGKRTEDGTVIYLVVEGKLKMSGTFYDKRKNRTILSEETARKILNKIKIKRVEEFPTYDRIELSEEYIGRD
ncbi:radical SAM protein [Candidatus Pacearchaeota archaeon]|nr:radical SAM protein [Candidatus Pacearchaeota archaeon]